MSSSGSFETGKYGGVRGLCFNWWINSQDIAGNYTDIGWNWVGSGSGSTWYYTLNGYLNVNGGRVYTQGSSKIQLSSGTVVASGTTRIYHNSDGSKSFGADGGATIYNYGTYQTGSGSWDLPTIPRTSTPSLSSNELNLGEKITINTNRKSTSLTHKLYYKINGGTETLLASNITDSYSWTIPKTLANNITTSDSGTIDFRLVTMVNGSEVGSSSVSMKVKVPSTTEFNPSISDVILSEEGSVPTTWGVYIKTLSKIKCVITAAGAYSSTISSYSTSFNNESFTSSTFTTSNISLTNPTIKVTVKDSRGRIATYEKVIEVIDYDVPTITKYNSYRNANNTSEIDLNFECKIYSLNDLNTTSFKYYYKTSTATSYSTIDIDLSKLTSNVENGIITYSGTLSMFTSDTATSYNAYLEATDYFKKSQTITMFINTVFKLINISSDKKYFAVGKLHEKYGYIEKALPEIHYDNIYRQDGDYNGIVLSCPSITNGKVNYDETNNTVEFDIDGTTYAISIYKASDNKEFYTKEEVDNAISKYKIKKLWENSNPSETFKSQTINLDLSGYNRILVISKGYINDSLQGNAIVKIGGDTVFMNANSTGIIGREVFATTSSVTFGVGKVLSSYLGSWSESNNACIPLEIYGFNVEE